MRISALKATADAMSERILQRLEMLAITRNRTGGELLAALTGLLMLCSLSSSQQATARAPHDDTHLCTFFFVATRRPPHVVHTWTYVSLHLSLSKDVHQCFEFLFRRGCEQKEQHEAVSPISVRAAMLHAGHRAATERR